MKQFFTIFRFELGNYLKNRVYRILTMLLIIGILAALSYPRLTQGNKQAEGEQTEQASQSMRIAVAGEGAAFSQGKAEELAAQLPLYTWTGIDVTEQVLTEAVNAGEYDAGLWLTDDLHYRYIVENAGMYDQSETMIAQALGNAYRIATLADKGVSPAEAGDIIAAQAEGMTVTTGKNQFYSFIYTYALVMLLYMAIVLYGQFVSMSVAGEKSTRAMELLITSARPTNLMFGKVLGAGTAGLLQIVALLAAAFVGYKLNQPLWQDNMMIQALFGMPASIFAYALLFFVMGFFLYAMMFGALGSLASRSEDVNTTTLPVTMLFIVAFMVIITAITSGNVESALMKAASFVPFTSPMAMFVRITMGTPSAAEIIISIAILLVSTIFVGFVAAAIYRIGVLLYGKPPKMKELIRAVRTAR